MIDPQTPEELAISWFQRSHLAKPLAAAAMRSCAADLMEMLSVRNPVCQCTHKLTEHLPTNGCAPCMMEYANNALHEFTEWNSEDDEDDEEFCDECLAGLTSAEHLTQPCGEEDR